MTKKILITYRGSQPPKQRAGYEDYWGDNIGPADRPKPKPVFDDSVPLATHVQKGVYALEMQAEELTGDPIWRAEVLAAAAALKKLRAQLLDPASVASATLDRAGLKY